MKTSNHTGSGFISRYSIVLFYILAFILGAATVILVVQGILPGSLTLASVLSASTAGIIMTAAEDGKAGLKLLLSRLLVWRVGVGYWLFALFLILPAVVVGSLFNPRFKGDPIFWGSMQLGMGILPMFMIFLIVSGLGQELGWTGFLTPRLQARYSALVASLIRAVLVGFWHIPLLVYARLQLSALADFPYDGWIAQKGLLVTFLTTVLVFQVPWSIFFSWLFNNTGGSLLLVVVLHGSEIWAADWMLRASLDPKNINNYWGYGGILILCAVAIVIWNGAQNLSRKHQKIVYQHPSG